jgi:membrane-bound metal-dependent hydrolase YbcI (DUF457 family)
MPSPIAHIATGYVLYRLSERSAPPLARQSVGPIPAGMLASMGFSLVADLDSVIGVVTGDFARFHNTLTHSLFIALGASLAFATFMLWRFGGGFRYWLYLALAAYVLHILMDSASVSRGVMAFWPFSSERFLFPVTIFYGLHWSDGLISPKHIVTFLTEAGFAAILILISRVAARRATWAEE